MLTNTDKLPIAIYHINNDYKERYGDWDAVIELIIECALKSKSSKVYEKQDLRENISELSKNQFRTQLYLCDGEPYPIKKISNFYSSIVNENSSILSVTKKDVSTLFFVYDDDELFVIPTGLGYFTIQDFIDYDFGLKIMSSMIDKTNNTIKNISYKSISGRVAFNTRMFRSEYSLLNEDDFGKLFNEICAIIPKESFIKKLGLSDDFSKKNITCIGKSAFKITKTIDIKQLFNIIIKLKPLLEQSKDIFNSVKYINNRGADKDKLNQLNENLINEIYGYIKAGKSELPFEIAHRDYKRYHMASHFQIFYNNKPMNEEKMDEPPADFQFLIDAAEMDSVVLSDFETFCEFIDKIEIYSYDDLDRVLTHGKLMKHISGEITFEEKTYFHIDEQWMQLEDKFIEDLNRNCREYLINFFDNSILDIAWVEGDKSHENEYIDKVCNSDKNCIKIHPIKTSEQLELCDIIKKTDGEEIQLIYIKDGFDHSIRDLTSQVMISQQRILEMKKSNEYEVLSDYYDNICRSENGSKLSNYSKEDFIEMFKRKKLTFVLAFRPKNHIGHTFMNEPEIFGSNIAKYSLVHTLKEIGNLDVAFNIKLCEIKNC